MQGSGHFPAIAYKEKHPFPKKEGLGIFNFIVPIRSDQFCYFNISHHYKAMTNFNTWLCRNMVKHGHFVAGLRGQDCASVLLFNQPKKTYLMSRSITRKGSFGQYIVLIGQSVYPLEYLLEFGYLPLHTSSSQYLSLNDPVIFSRVKFHNPDDKSIPDTYEMPVYSAWKATVIFFTRKQYSYNQINSSPEIIGCRSFSPVEFKGFHQYFIRIRISHSYTINQNSVRLF